MDRCVTTYYLEMTNAAHLSPSTRDLDGFEVRPVQDPSLNRSLYESVGSSWHWTDRLVWSTEDWKAWALRNELETWIAVLDGETAGYFELEVQSGGNVEIAYLGLLPGFIGRGLGGGLLTEAIRRSWAIGARRVWLHTCTLDHPQALANYKARGMRVYRVRIQLGRSKDRRS